MGIFIIYIDITKPLSHFECTNFKASLVIKTINFYGIKKMAYLTMLFIFQVNVITCQNFNLSHIYRIFAKKTHFLKWKFSNKYMVFEHGSNNVKWHGSIYFQFSYNVISYFLKIWNIFVFLSTQAHYICFHKHIPISHFMKWNEIIFILMFA